MLTGDSVLTAASVARQCGILPPSTDINQAVADGAAIVTAAEEGAEEGEASESTSAYGAGGDGGRLLVMEAAQFKRLVRLGAAGGGGADIGQLDEDAFRYGGRAGITSGLYLFRRLWLVRLRLLVRLPPFPTWAVSHITLIATFVTGTFLAAVATPERGC